MHGLGYQTQPNMVCVHGSYITVNKYATPSWWILYPKVLELSLKSVGFPMSLFPYAYLRVIPQRFLNSIWTRVSDDYWEFLNISTLDPLLPTFLIATLCFCILSVITYYSLVVAWEVFWASWWSPSPLNPSAEVFLTDLEYFWKVFIFWSITEPQSHNTRWKVVKVVPLRNCRGPWKHEY